MLVGTPTAEGIFGGESPVILAAVVIREFVSFEFVPGMLERSGA